jgi:hypothetical protein
MFDKSDNYQVDNNPWIVRLLPEQPTYLRSVTQNFADVLGKAFPTSAGWSYASSIAELSNKKWGRVLQLSIMWEIKKKLLMHTQGQVYIL